ncbi:MAG: M14 family zinc carboxypeptidase [Eubacteriales bacterium]|nr:M14 family zinc carboxypeptidase [Eubacteriales bacterium]
MTKFRYSYEQMMRRLDVLEKSSGRWMRKRVLEISADGRPIVEAILGEESAPRHVLIHAGIHGREYLNTALVLRQMEDYFSEEWEDQRRDDICFHVIPMVNPDGCTLSQEGLSGIQTQEVRERLEGWFQQAGEKGIRVPEKIFFEKWKSNARGVDINRNFGVGWEEYEGPEAPCGEGFKGYAPEEEAETRAVLKVGREYPIGCCIAYHSSGNLIYWDYGSKDWVYEADKLLAGMLGRETGYELHSTVADHTDQAGCSDYFVLGCGIPAVTVETGKADCPLPAEEFPEIYACNRGVWQSAAGFLGLRHI